MLEIGGFLSCTVPCSWQHKANYCTSESFTHSFGDRCFLSVKTPSFENVSEYEMVWCGVFLSCFVLFFPSLCGLVPLKMSDDSFSCQKQEMVINGRISMEGEYRWQHPKPLFLSLLILKKVLFFVLDWKISTRKTYARKVSYCSKLHCCLEVYPKTLFKLPLY